MKMSHSVVSAQLKMSVATDVPAWSMRVASKAPHRPCVAMQPSICLIGHAARLSLLKLDYCSLLIFGSSQNEPRRDVMTPVRRSFRMARIFQVSELFGSRILN